MPTCGGFELADVAFDFVLDTDTDLDGDCGFDGVDDFTADVFEEGTSAALVYEWSLFNACLTSSKSRVVNEVGWN